VLYEAGDLDRAQTVLADGAGVAAAAGAAGLQARIRVQQISTGVGLDAAVLEECGQAVAVLEAEGDLAGLAKAWLVTGQLRLHRGEWPADEEALERAVALGRQSGNHPVAQEATHWLAVSLSLLRVPVDAAISRAEQLLQGASGEPWAEARILVPLSELYAYAGRFAAARGALARARLVDTEAGAKLHVATSAILAGPVELMAGNPAAAERYLWEAYEMLRAMGERGYLATVAGELADVLYARERYDEAQRITEEAQAVTAADDIDAQARWRSVQAKLCARRGDFAVARQRAGEAEALVSPAVSFPVLHAEVLMAKAEVNRLAGAPDQAAASVRAALQIYQDRGIAPLAEQATAALASLAAAAGTATA
jgi:tetratricopeptide (TPR) repeat protein